MTMYSILNLIKVKFQIANNKEIHGMQSILINLYKKVSIQHNLSFM